MTKHLQRVITAGMFAVLFQTYPAIGQSLFEIQVPPVPAGIQPPAGNAAFLKGQAVGTQNYACLFSGTNFAWKFRGPQATVFVGLPFMNRMIFQQVATHFLSPNPAENGTARATWQNSLDSSAAWAKAIVTATDPNFVAPGAIPWLLLQVVGTQTGPTGGSVLAQTTFIQRLNTSGGAMPATGCSQSSDVGATAFVPYTADYYFYRAGH